MTKSQLISSKPHLNNENTNKSQMRLLAQGAEAKIFKIGNQIIKDRISKAYRHPDLDKKIIRQRTRREKNILEKASKIINTPKPEESGEENLIKMPFIAGKKLSDHLETLDWKSICKEIGHSIAKLHDNNIIHGDLTTSNMIWVEGNEKRGESNMKNAKLNKDNIKLINSNKKSEKNDLKVNNIKNINNCGEAEQAQASEQSKLYLIDFGLGFTSERIEDKAVDLHLIKQALEAKHFSIHKEAEKIILENYSSKDKTKVLEQLKKVEARGRYKH